MANQAKQVVFSDAARAKMFEGITKLNNAVAATMGPKGRNVVFTRPYGGPVITNDGVTIAKEIFFEDMLEDLGAQLVKEAATKTNDIAGDGTTTATVLAYAMIKEGLRNLAAGANPIVMRTGIEKAVEMVIEELGTHTKEITTKEEIEQVATISAQNAEVGKLIADVMEIVGKDGVITVEEGQDFGVSKKVVEGMQFDNGYVSPYMITDTSRMEASYEKPSILLVDDKLMNIQELVPLLEMLVKSGKKDIVIIAEDVGGDVLATLIANKMRGVFNAVAIRAPGFGERRKEMMKDIAAVTGATLISAEVGLKLENATPDLLGSARKVIVDKDTTTIIEGAGEKEQIETRVQIIKSQLEQTQSEFDIQKLHERLAKLSGGVGVIVVGAATEVELQEKKHRIEDALSATRAAVEEGIVAGGGTALLLASLALFNVPNTDIDEQMGITLVRNALAYPTRQIAQNAGKEGSVIVEKILATQESSFGYNAATDKMVNMFDAGIIDPKKVARSALQNAASVAAMFLSTEVAITDLPKRDDVKPVMSPMNQPMY